MYKIQIVRRYIYKYAYIYIWNIQIRSSRIITDKIIFHGPVESLIRRKKREEHNIIILVTIIIIKILFLWWKSEVSKTRALLTLRGTPRPLLTRRADWANRKVINKFQLLTVVLIYATPPSKRQEPHHTHTWRYVRGGGRLSQVARDHVIRAATDSRNNSHPRGHRRRRCVAILRHPPPTTVRQRKEYVCLWQRY